MDPARRQRYKDKAAHARERLDDIQNWLPLAEESKAHRLAVYKALQEAVEAITDVFAMVIKDDDGWPKDDYRNIETMVKQGRIDSSVQKALEEANGLRNRIVHEYNGLWDEVAVESVASLWPVLDGVVEEIATWP